MKPEPSTKRKKRSIRTFAAASFLNDLGSDMIQPVWPLFLTVFLGASLSIVGFIDGLGEAIVSLSQAASGYFSDRTKKRKPFIYFGYLFASLSRVGYALSSAWQHVIPFKVIDRAGKMRDAPRDAIVADISKKKERGKNFGFITSMDNLGAVIGVLLSIMLFTFIGFRKLFLIAAIPSVISVFLILFFIKEKKTKVKLHKGISFKNLSGNLKLFLILSAIFAISTFSYSFLLIFAKELGFSLFFIPVLYLIFTAIASASSYQFGKLSDKIGRKLVIMLAYIFWGITAFIFILTQSLTVLTLTFVVYGLHKGALDPTQRAFVSELAPRKFKASTLGGFRMVVGLAALPASLIAGILWDQVSILAPFYFALSLTLVAIILLTFIKEK